MKKFIERIIEILNQPSDKVDPYVSVAIIVITMIISKNVDSKNVIIFGIMAGLVMLIYTVMSILKHEDITKTLIYLIIVLMAVVLIIMYYSKKKGVDFSIIGIIFPMLLILLMIVIYKRIKRLGNRNKIKQAKIILIFETILMALVSIFFIYLSLYK